MNIRLAALDAIDILRESGRWFDFVRDTGPHAVIAQTRYRTYQRSGSAAAAAGFLDAIQSWLRHEDHS